MAPGKNQHLPFIAINVYHSMTLRNADPDLNEISGGSTDLGQKIARIGGFPYTHSPPSLCEIRRLKMLIFDFTYLITYV